MRKILAAICLVAAMLTPAAAKTTQSVGLVLSGGGAKGVAHIGVIKALEDNGIPIDYITGTSMGAIVGGLYACGYSPEEMLQLINSEYFLTMAQGKIDPSLQYYFYREAQSPRMFSFALGPEGGVKDKSFDFNPQSLIAPTPMNYGFMEIFTPYTAQCKGNFDNLMVPFRCVASNLSKHRPEVLGHGSVGEAVRASMSYPIVFQPVEIDGNIMYDGGIYDNFPVEVMDTVFKPAFMIGVDVSSPDAKIPNTYMQQLDVLVSQPQSYAVPSRNGIRLRVDLSKYSLLDFQAGAAICETGYRAAMEMMDSIRSRVSARVEPAAVAARRADFRKATPSLVFNQVNVSGGTRQQNDFIKYIFRPHHHADTLSEKDARLAFYRVLSSGKVSAIRSQAHLTPGASDLFTLDLDIKVKQKFSLGMGGYITSSNNSYLYAGVGYSSLSFSSLSTSVELWVGQSYLATALRAGLNLPSAFPSALRFLAVASRRRYYEDEELFYRDSEPAFVVKHQYYGRLGWAFAAGRKGTVEIGGGGGRLYNTFYENTSLAGYIAGRDRNTLDLGQLYAEYSSGSLDDVNFPTSGYQRNASLAYFGGLSRYRGHDSEVDPAFVIEKEHVMWGQLKLDIKQYLQLKKHWALGIEAQLLLSTRKLLSDYYSSISSAAAFYPTPASHNVFDARLRANSFVTFGLVPIYKFSKVDFRLAMHAFKPLRPILEGPDATARYGKWFERGEFFGEFDVVAHLPFGSLSGYCNYSTSRNDYNVGIAFGVYIDAPSFLNQ